MSEYKKEEEKEKSSVSGGVPKHLSSQKAQGFVTSMLDKVRASYKKMKDKENAKQKGSKQKNSSTKSETVPDTNVSLPKKQPQQDGIPRKLKSQAASPFSPPQRKASHQGNFPSFPTEPQKETSARQASQFGKFPASTKTNSFSPSFPQKDFSFSQKPSQVKTPQKNDKLASFPSFSPNSKLGRKEKTEVFSSASQVSQPKRNQGSKDSHKIETKPSPKGVSPDQIDYESEPGFPAYNFPKRFSMDQKQPKSHSVGKNDNRQSDENKEKSPLRKLLEKQRKLREQREKEKEKQLSPAKQNSSAEAGKKEKVSSSPNPSSTRFDKKKVPFSAPKGQKNGMGLWGELPSDSKKGFKLQKSGTDIKENTKPQKKSEKWNIDEKSLQPLLNYIEKAYRLGAARIDIYRSLQKVGWREEFIEAAFTKFNQNQ